MNIKMAINSQVSTIECENKLSKEEQRHNYGYRECFDGCQRGGQCGRMGEEVRGLRSTSR